MPANGKPLYTGAISQEGGRRQGDTRYLRVAVGGELRGLLIEPRRGISLKLISNMR